MQRATTRAPVAASLGALAAFVGVLAAFVGALAAFVGALAGCGGGAEHLVAEPARLVYGRVLRGDASRQLLRLRNDGEREVFVTSVLSNCSCVQVAPFHGVLQPGEEQEIAVAVLATEAFPTDKLQGKKVDVVSNDPLVPRIEVPIEAEFVRGCTIVPAELRLGPLGEPRSREAKVLQVRAGPGIRIRVAGARASPVEAFEVSTREVEGGADLTVRLKADAGVTAPLSAALEVRVEVEGEGIPRRTIAYQVRIVGG